MNFLFCIASLSAEAWHFSLESVICRPWSVIGTLTYCNGCAEACLKIRELDAGRYHAATFMRLDTDMENRADKQKIDVLCGSVLVDEIEYCIANLEGLEATECPCEQVSGDPRDPSALVLFRSYDASIVPDKRKIFAEMCLSCVRHTVKARMILVDKDD